MVKELETLLIAERVTEPKGFANTYHQWTGRNNAAASDADNWSDYVYANAGITYMTDDGAPQLSWVAHMENTGTKSNTAQAESDLEVLALHIRGNQKTGASQTLALDSNVGLIGRNEIRIGPHGMLTMNHGTVSSLRWVDIQRGGTLNGTGTIDATVYNHGSVAVTDMQFPSIRIDSDYCQADDGALSVPITSSEQPPLTVAGNAVLAGSSVFAASSWRNRRWVIHGQSLQPVS